MNDVTEPRESPTAGEIVIRAAAVWRKAQVLHVSPSWEGIPEARVMAEAIALHHPDCEPWLIDLLNDNSQLVVGYALMTLEMMNSEALLQLPNDLLDRRSNITLSCGSMRYGMDIGGLARQIQKRVRTKVAWQDGPPTAKDVGQGTPPN